MRPLFCKFHWFHIFVEVSNKFLISCKTKLSGFLLKAEDRAHRRGQTNAVNVYIFCAKVLRIFLLIPNIWHWDFFVSLPLKQGFFALMTWSFCRIPWMSHIGKI